MNLDLMRDRQCRLVITMTTGKMTDDGNIKIRADIQYDFIYILAERNLAVSHFQHFTNHQAADTIKRATALQMQHHAVKGIQFFIDILEEQDASAGVDLVWRPQPLNE